LDVEMEALKPSYYKSRRENSKKALDLVVAALKKFEAKETKKWSSVKNAWSNAVLQYTKISETQKSTHKLQILKEYTMYLNKENKKLLEKKLKAARFGKEEVEEFGCSVREEAARLADKVDKNSKPWADFSNLCKWTEDSEDSEEPALTKTRCVDSRGK